MTPAQAKVPLNPPARLTIDPTQHLNLYSGRLWRIFSSKGRYRQTWDQMRHYGPVARMRFDPHPLPTQNHADHSVMYAALGSSTAFGEVYQQKRVINRGLNGGTLVAWEPTRELRLLDLTTTWPVQNGASASLMMAPKRYTRNWAHQIHEQFGTQIDGLYHVSSIDFGPMITLFTPAEDSFPALPTVLTRLDDPRANMYIAKAALRLNYGVTR